MKYIETYEKLKESLKSIESRRVYLVVGHDMLFFFFFKALWDCNCVGCGALAEAYMLKSGCQQYEMDGQIDKNGYPLSLFLPMSRIYLYPIKFLS
jgi:hypothetical protein